MSINTPPEQTKNPETIQTMTEEAPADTIKNVKPKDWYTRSESSRFSQDAKDSDFLDQARLRPQQPTRYSDLIINTLIELARARCRRRMSNARRR